MHPAATAFRREIFANAAYKDASLLTVESSSMTVTSIPKPDLRSGTWIIADQPQNCEFRAFPGPLLLAIQAMEFLTQDEIARLSPTERLALIA